jgi:hypothetical protein
MPILAWVAALRVTGSQSGNSPAAEYAVYALLALALGLIVLCLVKGSMTGTSKTNHR